MRLAFAALLAVLCVSLTTAAPVPKRDTPKLTSEQLVGTWAYAWANSLDGCICFNADHSYGAVHDWNTGVTYGGTWRIEGNTVTITEFSFDFASGERRGGPCDYKFDFQGTVPPVLSGVSNGSVPVKLWNKGK